MIMFYDLWKYLGGWSGCIPEQEACYSPEHMLDIGVPHGVLLGRVRQYYHFELLPSL